MSVLVALSLLLQFRFLILNAQWNRLRISCWASSQRRTSCRSARSILTSPAPPVKVRLYIVGTVLEYQVITAGKISLSKVTYVPNSLKIRSTIHIEHMHNSREEKEAACHDIANPARRIKRVSWQAYHTRMQQIKFKSMKISYMTWSVR